MTEETIKAIKELREKSKRRNFSQTFDLIVNLKDLDMKKPENRIMEDLILPHGKGKEVKIALFSDSWKTTKAKVINSAQIENLSKNKREAKKLAKDFDFFLAEPKLMPLIGKSLGQFLGPRGKMPKIVVGDVETMIQSYKKAVKIKLIDSPVIQCAVGNEKMEDKEIAENIEAVMNFLQLKLPKGKQNISNVKLKLTMSKPVKVGI